MTGELSWREIRDFGELATLEPQWWSLWNRAKATTPFQSPAWLLPWWSVFSPGDLVVQCAWRRNRLVGLAPFYLETGHRGRRLLPIGISITDYHDVLVIQDEADAFCAALPQRMSECGCAWETWELTELTPDADAIRIAAPSGCGEIVEQCTACPVLALPATVDELAGVIPARKRRSLRLARNRAARRGPVEILAADADSVATQLETVVRLHRLRWENIGEPGVLADPRVQRFHRESAPRLMNSGLLRLYELRIAGRSAAAYYGFNHHERAFAYLTGFDPAYEFESPGAILLAHAIETAIREGAREFHMLRGQEPYKYGWGAVDRWNSRRIFQRTAERAAETMKPDCYNHTLRTQ